jgi:hypothetical protein
MSYAICFLTGFAIVIGAWGYHARRDIQGQNIMWSNVTVSQLELHQKLAIAMADRVHLDPYCRELLKHQVKVLKAVGVVGNREEAIDVTAPPSGLELEAYGPRANGPFLSRPVEGPKIKYSSIDEHNRSRGYRVQGDPDTESETEAEQERSGFGWYENEKGEA